MAASERELLKHMMPNLVFVNAEVIVQEGLHMAASEREFVWYLI
jgi:hypothetical protein